MWALKFSVLAWPRERQRFAFVADRCLEPDPLRVGNPDLHSRGDEVPNAGRKRALAQMHVAATAFAKMNRSWTEKPLANFGDNITIHYTNEYKRSKISLLRNTNRFERVLTLITTASTCANILNYSHH